MLCILHCLGHYLRPYLVELFRELFNLIYCCITVVFIVVCNCIFPRGTREIFEERGGPIGFLSSSLPINIKIRTD